MYIYTPSIPGLIFADSPHFPMRNSNPSAELNPNPVVLKLTKVPSLYAGMRMCWAALFSALKASSLKKTKNKKKQKHWKQNRCFPTEGPRRAELSGCNHGYTSTWGCKTRLQHVLRAVADEGNANAVKLSSAKFDWCLDGVISEALVLRGSEPSDLLSDGWNEIDWRDVWLKSCRLAVFLRENRRGGAREGKMGRIEIPRLYLWTSARLRTLTHVGVLICESEHFAERAWSDRTEMFHKNLIGNPGVWPFGAALINPDSFFFFFSRFSKQKSSCSQHFLVNMSSSLDPGTSTTAESEWTHINLRKACNEEQKRLCDAEMEERGPGGEWMISAWLNATKLNQDEAISTSSQLQPGKGW